MNLPTEFFIIECNEGDHWIQWGSSDYETLPRAIEAVNRIRESTPQALDNARFRFARYVRDDTVEYDASGSIASSEKNTI